MKTFQYRCRTCGEIHDDLPAFGVDYPDHYVSLPEAERAARTVITDDVCVIDDKWFYVRGCVEIPIHGYVEPLVWLVWVLLSENSFRTYVEKDDDPNRADTPPFFAWLTSVPYMYPEAQLKTMVHLRPFPERPYIELEPTRHPLSVDQRNGISSKKAQALAEQLLHG